ncbi:zinc finger BED domain-containing protein 4-like [Zeugodacus cucurbitae]|uniref:zinc finger BED domain-containing protein 4-like n=1 Tax=Zeugodacus cucurbitae TaxID=28588 RepID=UPI0023D8E3D1|nr:zinc finger BED domain-containing protein 4-like [Zeugodacus cucurbitae]
MNITPTAGTTASSELSDNSSKNRLLKHVWRKKIIPCFAHTLNLVVTQSIDKSTEVSALITKVRDIVKFIKRSVNASDQLRQKQIDIGASTSNTKKMILDVRTRWNSCFYMLERFVQLAPILSEVLLTRPEAPSMVNASELNKIKELIELLKCFEIVNREISADTYVTISKVIPLVSCLTEALTKISAQDAIVGELKSELQKNMNKRFDKLEFNSVLALATVLDLRFKLLHFKDALANKKKTVLYLNSCIKDANNSVSTSESSDEFATENPFDIWSHHKQLAHQNMKCKFSNSSAITTTAVASINQNPTEMWDYMKNVFPELYKQASKYLSIVATSVPSERLFSKAGATITKQRNRLTGKRLSKLLFLNSVLNK